MCGDPDTPSSNPADLVALGNTVFFTTSDGDSESGLWKSDGTQAGTVLVKEIDRRLLRRTGRPDRRG